MYTSAGRSPFAFRIHSCRQNFQCSFLFFLFDSLPWIFCNFKKGVPSELAANRNVSWVGFLDADERLWRDNEQCLPNLLHDANFNATQVSFNWRFMAIYAATTRGKSMHQQKLSGLQSSIGTRYGSKYCDWSLGVLNLHLKSFVRQSLVRRVP